MTKKRKTKVKKLKPMKFVPKTEQELRELEQTAWKEWTHAKKEV